MKMVLFDQNTVGEDDALGADEKQVTFSATKSEDKFRVHSEVASVTRRLLNCDAVEFEDFRMADGEVVSCTVLVPVSHVCVATEGRQSDAWCHLVSERTLR